MDKNENDPFENTNEKLEKQPEEKMAPAPLLTPETIKQMTPQSEVRKQDEIEIPEASSKGSGKKKAILLATACTLVAAGAVTVAVLAGTGAFGKDKNKETKPEETTAATTTTEKKETTTATTTTAATSETSASEESMITEITFADVYSESTIYITSLSELKDDQIKTLKDMTLEEFKKDLENQNVADQVTVDEFNYIGSLLMESWDPQAIDNPFMNSVFPVYQVQITDTTTGTPVKRQIFYSSVYSVRKDGEIKAMQKELYIETMVYFEKWETFGSLDSSRLIEDIREWMNQKLDDDIDESRLLPFDGKQPEEFEKGGTLVSLDQITPELERAIEENVSAWLGPDFTKFAPAGVVLNSYEIVGKALAVSSTGKYSKLFVIAEYHYTDLRGEKPEEKSFFWYEGFPHICQNGELRTGTACYEGENFDFMNPQDWIDNFQTLEDARKACESVEMGWSFTTDFDDASKGNDG